MLEEFRKNLVFTKYHCLQVLMHESTMRGREGVFLAFRHIVLYTLLPLYEQLVSHFRNGADQNQKNDKGESAYDMAVKGGYENLVKKFAAQLGQSQLDKMIRPKSKAY